MNFKKTPLTIWMTGLSGAGKTTLARTVQRLFQENNQHVVILDGDSLRQGLCSDLQYSLKDRSENIRRTAEVARLMNDAGVTVIVALISPMVIDRSIARKIIGNLHFIETYLAADLFCCESRDPKGLYLKARAGQVNDFTGITSPYEVPENPDILVDTSILSERESAYLVFDQIHRNLQKER